MPAALATFAVLDGGRPAAPGFAALAAIAALMVAGPLRPASPRWRPATTLSG